jgi:hypothetical protein
VESEGLTVGRIRTIKPEFPQSESIGRLSREARLFFILLWTICDDSGKTRAASRMLASLLYPYDDDAPKLIDGWIEETEREGCVARYVVNGTTYIQVCKWLIHQKIDRPSQSRLPEFDEVSRVIANPRGALDADLGPRTVDLVSRTVDQKKEKEPRRKSPALVSLPEDFKISENVRRWAEKNNVMRLDEHFEFFVSQAQAKDYRYADWDAALRNAITKDWAGLRFAPRQNNQAPGKNVRAAMGLQEIINAERDNIAGRGSDEDATPARLGFSGPASG